MKQNPRANSFDIWDCGDPKCGIHIISYDAAGKVMVETVASAGQTLQLIRACQNILYKKVTER